MENRIIIDKGTGKKGVILGILHISRGGTLYIPTETKKAIVEHSDKTGANILKSNVVVSRGLDHTIRITDEKTDYQICKELATALDTSTKEGRQLYRSLCDKRYIIESIEGKYAFRNLIDYLGIVFDSNERKKRVFIGYIKSDSDRVYFIMNPDYCENRELSTRM